MKIFTIYLIGVSLSAVIGILLCALFSGGLKTFLEGLFPEAVVQKFWARMINIIIVLASISGSMTNTYPENAGDDKLVLVWAIMDQFEGMLFRLLWTLLILFTILLFGWAITTLKDAKKKK
jgi:hypothetical protein